MPPSALLSIDGEVFLEHFPEEHFRLRHALEGHPLFELERLLELAEFLPPECVEFNAADVAISQNPASTPRTGLSARETISRIDEAESWMVLKYAEIDPEYRELLWDCVREIASLSEVSRPGAHQLECYIFVSSPGSITPLHFDDEHNFLLQLRGSKTVHTWRTDSVGAASEEEIERYYCENAHRNLPLRPGNPAPDESFILQPGDGMHVPVHSCHWVKNGADVSVSFSVTFRSRELAREVLIHRVNHRLRRLGLRPRSYGRVRWSDEGKYLSGRVARKVNSGLRRLGRG